MTVRVPSHSILAMNTRNFNDADRISFQKSVLKSHHPLAIAALIRSLVTTNHKTTTTAA
jgi:RNA polymerase-interacting CarD/CdnL/TRCF family regulator